MNLKRSMNLPKELKLTMRNSVLQDSTEPIRLHLELSTDYLTDDQKRMLKRYGESRTGDSITRDILIPSDMPLHNLHYAIQKLFGWQNSHLRKFELPEADYDRLTGGTVRGWSELVGVLFQPPSEAESDLFWDDDYVSGSFKTWLKKKYTGPYIYQGFLEIPELAKQDMKELIDQFPMMDVRESFMAYQERTKDTTDKKIKIVKRAPLIDLTLQELNDSIILDGGTTSLLERLEIDQLLAAQGERMNPGKTFPAAKELIYYYDFGDNWIITITKYRDCKDLLKNNDISEYELEEAKSKVIEQYKPVCIHRNGVYVMDDTGGLPGFADVLAQLYEGEDKEEQASFKVWTKSQGWSDKRESIKTML